MVDSSMRVIHLIFAQTKFEPIQIDISCESITIFDSATTLFPSLVQM